VPGGQPRRRRLTPPNPPALPRYTPCRAPLGARCLTRAPALFCLSSAPQVSGASNTTVPSVEASTHGARKGGKRATRSAVCSPEAKPSADEEEADDNCSSGRVADAKRG
jgi:hypothetical protein